MNINKKISINKIIIRIMYIVFSVVSILLIFNIKDMEFINWKKMFVILIFSVFIIQCFFMKIIKLNIFSLSGIFLVLSYLFHFGQLIIMVLFPDYNFGRFNYYAFYDSSGLKEASGFALITILMVGFGIISSFINKHYFNIKIDSESNLKQYKMIGWIIVFISFPIQVYIDFTKIYISITHGYLETYNIGIAGVWGSIGFLSFIGFVLLILGYSRDKKKSISLFVFIIVYLLITMISGHRGHQIIKIIFYFYVFNKAIYKIKAKNILLYGILGFFMLALLNTIMAIRSIEGKTLGLFLESLLEALKGDSLKDMIVELGGTINTMYLVIQQVPKNTSHTYGITYITSIFSIMPNIGGVFTNLNNNSIYQKNIIGSALGGSYIGELYYNFSYFGIVVGFFIGSFISRISQKFDLFLENKDYLRVAYYSPLFIYILWWVRDSFYSMVRPFIWTYIVVYILKKSISIRKTKI